MIYLAILHFSTFYSSIFYLITLHFIPHIHFILFHWIIMIIIIRSVDFSLYESLINVKEQKSSSWSSLSAPPTLKFSNFEEKLKFPFLLAQHNYEPSIPELRNIMITLFKNLKLLNDSQNSQISNNIPDENITPTLNHGSGNPSSGISGPGSATFCPQVGPHWEQIGFQGLDPRTGDNK